MLYEAICPLCGYVLHYHKSKFQERAKCPDCRHSWTVNTEWSGHFSMALRRRHVGVRKRRSISQSKDAQSKLEDFAA